MLIFLCEDVPEPFHRIRKPHQLIDLPQHVLPESFDLGLALGIRHEVHITKRLLQVDVFPFYEAVNVPLKFFQASFALFQLQSG